MANSSNNPYHILVAEDDPVILELIRINLERSGYKVTCHSSGEKVLLSAGIENPDLILLDLLLPGIDGIQVCRLLRGEEKTKNTPIIMVTAKSEEQDIVEGLEAGADDYITKPFSPKVLLARMQAVFRRRGRVRDNTQTGKGAIRIRHLTIDPNRHIVTIENKRVALTVTEFQLLYYLAQQPGWVFTRDQIVEAVRGDDYHVTDRAVDVVVFGLRKKLAEYGGFIETVRGVGYRFAEDAEIGKS
jgi:two-component system, OmpR family, alkaline phosphatase synthesis response regulator PhoP